MLRVMRKHASRWMLGVFCFIIIVSFVFTFGFNGMNDDKTVAEVGPYKISAMEYHDVYDKTVNYYRMLYRDKFDDDMKKELKLKEKVMDQLVDKYLFLKKAEDMGLKVSDKEFGAYVAGIDAFKRNGKFDEQAYREVLKRNNLEPKTFEENEKRSLIIAKMVAIVHDNAPQSDEKAAYESYLKERGQVKLSVAVFDPDDYKDKVSIDEKEVSALYEKEKGVHRSENTYHLKYVLIDEKSGVKDDQAYMELLKSKDITAYGKSKGIEVVDLGTLKESDLMAKFSRLKINEWLKGMNKGDISLPVREGSRSLIFQIVDREDGKPLEKEEVLKAIRARVAGEKAKLTARVKAEDAIKDKSLKPGKDTGFLPRNSVNIAGIGQVPTDAAGIFLLSKGQAHQKPVEIGGKYYVFACVDEKEPDKAQWEKEKETYKRIFAAMSKDAYLGKFKEDLRKSIKVKIDWNSI
jgi:peptidyl-prolyl cis-trans isomerase D